MWMRGELQRMKNIQVNETRVIRLVKGEHGLGITQDEVNKYHVVFYVPTDQGEFQLPEPAYRLLMQEVMEVVKLGMDPYGPWIGFEIARRGEGIDSQYGVWKKFIPAIPWRSAGDPVSMAPNPLRRIGGGIAAISSSVDPNYIAPYPSPRPTAPMARPRTDILDDEYHYGRKLCECGAAKTGIKDYQAGHSHWCPVK